MLVQQKNYTTKWHDGKRGVSVQLNELPIELIDGVRRLGVAIKELIIVTDSNVLGITFNPNYDPDHVWEAIDEILTAHYDLLPEAFTEFINGL